MNRVFLLTLVAAALALAGCSTNDGGGAGGDGPGGNGTTESPPQQITEAQAQQLLEDAGDNMPERFGMVVTVTKSGAEVVRMTGAVDNASGESYFDIKMDPSVFEQEAGDAEELAASIGEGFAFYATPEGVVYIVNDTAFAFPASESGEDSFVPSPEESPFGQFMDPTEAFGDLGDNVTVHSVRPITHKGKAAYEVQASIQDEEDDLSNATIVVYREPARLARIEGDIPMDEEDSDQLAGGRAVLEMLYENEVQIDVPERAKRAAGLRYDGGGFSFGADDGPKTWTFQGGAGIPLAEVEAQVKDVTAAGGEDSSLDSLSKAPTLWSMKLSEGTKTQGGVTLTFTDADGDAKVSAGDTLRIEGEDANGMPAQVVLFDAKTGTYVVPGAGLALAALALAGAALVLRRK